MAGGKRYNVVSNHASTQASTHADWHVGSWAWAWAERFTAFVFVLNTVSSVVVYEAFLRYVGKRGL